MYICYAHKDGHHQTAIMEIFILVYLFNDYDFTIRRSNDSVLRFAIKHTYGATEKVYDNCSNYCGNAKENIERHEGNILEEKEKQGIEHRIYTQGEDKGVCAFMVQAHILQTFDSFHSKQIYFSQS